jgi:predicted transposase YdaD
MKIMENIKNIVDESELKNLTIKCNKIHFDALIKEIENTIDEEINHSYDDFLLHVKSCNVKVELDNNTEKLYVSP